MNMDLTDPRDPRHGTVNGYSNHGCRCPACVAAHRDEQRDQRERRFAATRANGGIAPPPAVHGSPSTYGNWRCSCGPCLAAHAKAARDRRAAEAVKRAKRLEDRRSYDGRREEGRTRWRSKGAAVVRIETSDLGSWWHRHHHIHSRRPESS